jgi:hypothetical protein
MKNVDSKVTVLQDANYAAFKQAEKTKAEIHAAHVRAAKAQSRKAARDRK